MLSIQTHSSKAIAVRTATPADAAAIAVIYNDEVTGGVTNYEVKQHSATERRLWLEGLAERGYPILVAEAEGTVIGFCAITPFHPVSGYRYTATGSIYIAREHRRTGVGHALGEAMIAEARRRGLHTLIGGVNSENRASLALLESFGFQRVGYFREIGRKNGQWHDDICLQLLLETEETR
jgi:L-amino acid N-acyltransferase